MKVDKPVESFAPSFGGPGREEGRRWTKEFVRAFMGGVSDALAAKVREVLDGA